MAHQHQPQSQHPQQQHQSYALGAIQQQPPLPYPPAPLGATSYPPSSTTSMHFLLLDTFSIYITKHLLPLTVIYAPPPANSNPNIPPGLEYLTVVDQLLIEQKVEMLEVFTGWETNNKYAIRNVMGQNVYFAVEGNKCFFLKAY